MRSHSSHVVRKAKKPSSKKRRADKKWGKKMLKEVELSVGEDEDEEGAALEATEAPTAAESSGNVLSLVACIPFP